MIATHPHADHIGGLIAILDAFDVDELWHNEDTSKSKTYDDFMDRVNAVGGEVIEARRVDTIVADGLTLDVPHPVEPLVEDTNNNSIVLMLSYGDIDFLFTGDAEEEAGVSMIAAGVDNRYGHTHEETLAALEEIGATVYGTDSSGYIVVTTDG